MPGPAPAHGPRPAADAALDQGHSASGRDRWRLGGAAAAGFGLEQQRDNFGGTGVPVGRLPAGERSPPLG